MVMIETSRVCRRYIWCRSSKSTQKSSSPRKKLWSRYLTPNIFVSSLDMRMYHLCKLYICVPRFIASSSVTKGCPSLYGTTTTLVIGRSSVLPYACSSVNPVSRRNSTSCWSGSLVTTRGSNSFCTIPRCGTVFPHFLFLWCAFISVRSKSEGILIGPGGLFRHL